MARRYGLDEPSLTGRRVAGPGEWPGGGLHWIGVETIAALVWAIAGAWRFLIGVVDDQRS